MPAPTTRTSGLLRGPLLPALSATIGPPGRFPHPLYTNPACPAIPRGRVLSATGPLRRAGDTRKRGSPAAGDTSFSSLSPNTIIPDFCLSRTWFLSCSRTAVRLKPARHVRRARAPKTSGQTEAAQRTPSLRRTSFQSPAHYSMTALASPCCLTISPTTFASGKAAVIRLTS